VPPFVQGVAVCCQQRTDKDRQLEGPYGEDPKWDALEYLPQCEMACPGRFRSDGHTQGPTITNSATYPVSLVRRCTSQKGRPK
jgi:hypothetical protein